MISQIISCFQLHVQINILTLIGESHSFEHIHCIETSLNANISQVRVVIGVSFLY